MHVDLHWLDVPERVKYKLVSMVHNCLHQKAPQYLTDCCIPISDVASRRHLRSASCHHLVVPRHNLSATLEIQVTGHSRASKVTPFDSLPMVSYYRPIVKTEARKPSFQFSKFNVGSVQFLTNHTPKFSTVSAHL